MKMKIERSSVEEQNEIKIQEKFETEQKKIQAKLEEEKVITAEKLEEKLRQEQKIESTGNKKL